jgi:hypothetical protein
MIWLFTCICKDGNAQFNIFSSDNEGTEEDNRLPFDFVGGSSRAPAGTIVRAISINLKIARSSGAG